MAHSGGCQKRFTKILDSSDSEIFEKCSISFKIKAHEDFNHRNILNILRIKIRMQRRDWAKGAFCKGLAAQTLAVALFTKGNYDNGGQSQ